LGCFIVATLVIIAKLKEHRVSLQSRWKYAAFKNQCFTR
jgi:hypothetical protein